MVNSVKTEEIYLLPGGGYRGIRAKYIRHYTLKGMFDMFEKERVEHNSSPHNQPGQPYAQQYTREEYLIRWPTVYKIFPNEDKQPRKLTRKELKELGKQLGYIK